MSAERGINRNIQQARTRPQVYLAAVAVLTIAFFGAAISWAVREMPRLDLPVWIVLAIPVVCLIILLMGLFYYDALVLMTFCLIGFVRFEPAPFDLLLVALLGIGLLSGRLRLPSTKHGILVQLGLWGLIVANLLSILGAVPDAYNLRFLGITLFMLSIFVFIRMYTIEPYAMRLVLIGFTASAVFNTLPVVISFLGLSLPFSVLAWSIRGLGFFKDPNVYSPFIVVAAFWIIDRIMQPPFQLSRTGILVLLAVLLGVGSVLSLSRAAWVNLVIVGCFYFGFLLHHAPRKGIIFLLFTLTFVLIVSFFFYHFGLGDTVELHWKLQGYDEVRFSIQKAGIIAGLTHPVGVGPAGWPNTHSLYVKTLAEHGIFGLASLGILIGALVFPLTRRAWVEVEKAEVITARVLMAIIMGQLVNSLVIDSIHWRHLWVVLGLAWAFLASYRKKEI